MTISNLPRAPKTRRAAGLLAVACALVAGFEGVRQVAYYDSVMVPTICFGETRGVKMGDTATRAQCDAMLKESVADFARAIDACLPADIPDPTYVAFLSVSYNIGTAAFCSSSMARHANAGSLQAACDSLLMWDKVTIAGVKTRLPGLSRRRAEERALCRTGFEGKDV